MLIPVISLWQPWASWVALGWKGIETRTHNRFSSLVGKTIGIHAALKWDVNAVRIAWDFLSGEQRRKTEEFLRVGGAIICTAHVAEHRRLELGDAPRALIECVTPRWGLVLDKIQAKEAIPVRGKQGIWYFEVV